MAKRDQARLMVIDRTSGTIHHAVFSELAQFLPNNALMVINNSKVVPARLLGNRKTGGKVEIFLLKSCGDGYTFETLVRPLGKLKHGEQIKFAEGITAEVVDFKKKLVRFNKKNIDRKLSKIGHMPLPPYIKREDERIDHKEYQTVYAKHAGSVASPTAGLHFTRPMLNVLKKKMLVVPVTLHINYATFKGVETQDIRDHKMHFETFRVEPAHYRKIMQARGIGKEESGKKEEGRKTIAVGTTSCRVLETIGATGKQEGETNIFIYPSFKFTMTDILITNFHLPKSTLLMLVHAFGGVDLMKRAYEEAIRKRYRFYSYGDCMIII